MCYQLLKLNSIKRHRGILWNTYLVAMLLLKPVKFSHTVWHYVIKIFYKISLTWHQIGSMTNKSRKKDRMSKYLNVLYFHASIHNKSSCSCKMDLMFFVVQHPLITQNMQKIVFSVMLNKVEQLVDCQLQFYKFNLLLMLFLRLMLSLWIGHKIKNKCLCQSIRVFCCCKCRHWNQFSYWI